MKVGFRMKNGGEEVTIWNDSDESWRENIGDVNVFTEAVKLMESRNTKYVL